MSRELSAAAETFVARLDRVPLNRFHWRLLVLSGLGWMFDAMDVLMLSFLLTPIRGEFKLDATGVGLVALATSPRCPGSSLNSDAIGPSRKPSMSTSIASNIHPSPEITRTRQ